VTVEDWDRLLQCMRQQSRVRLPGLFVVLLSRVAIETQVDWHYELMISSLGKISERRDRLIFCGARAENPDFSQVAVV